MELTSYEKCKKSLEEIKKSEVNRIFNEIIRFCEGMTVRQTRSYLMDYVEENLNRTRNPEIEDSLRWKMDRYVENLKVTIIE
ncbi:hypothetical protein [Carnobacterium maltaromaticum]|uniref:hypothetical protein n=1 Tax=Carnobacterium maltaromaticum TaxID=2751 RepID=UPI0012FC4B42|nr:hypothetical protein [Carnobacterium maltaromaticum]